MKRYIKSATVDVLSEPRSAQLDFAKDPNTRPNKLTALAQSDIADVIREVAKNPSTPEDTLIYIVDEYDEAIGYYVLYNPNISRRVLQYIADNGGNYICYRLVNILDTIPQDILDQLANMDYDDIRAKIAQHKNTSPDTLARLAEDENYMVRFWALQNPNTPEELRSRLSSSMSADLESADYDIRESIASHPNTPGNVLAMLAESNDVLLLRRIAKNPNTPPDVLEKLAYTWGVESSAVQNPNAPAELLDKRSRASRDHYERAMIAENPNTAESTLYRLAKSKDDRIREGVARNVNAPTALLQKLADDEYACVSHAAKRNKNYVEPEY